jgi:hypothetical protein
MSGGWWSGPRFLGPIGPKPPPELALDGKVDGVTFARSLWRSLALLGVGAAIGPYILPIVARRVRVRWNADAVVVDSWPSGAVPGRRLARADVIAVRCGRSELAIRLGSGEEVRVVDGRRVVRGDLERGRELAYKLGIPIVDDSGATVALPTARVR